LNLRQSQKPDKALLLIFALYICFRLYAFYMLPRQGYMLGFDAAQYMRDAHCSILSTCLYTDRPFFYPLFIKLCLYNYKLISFSQCLISMLGWGFLAYCVNLHMQSKLIARMAFAFILLYSCAAYLILWDVKILTESLSISFLLMFIGFYLLALQFGFSKLNLAGLVIFAFLLVSVRDGNAYFVLLSGIATLIASFFSNSVSKKAALILLTAFLLIFLLDNLTINLGLRWFEPMSDLLANRMVNDPSLSQYFLQHGMPNILQQIQTVQGTFGGYPVLLGNPTAKAWFIAHGRSVYLHYLLSHPAYLLDIYLNPVFWHDLFLAPSLVYAYATYGLGISGNLPGAYILTYYFNSLSQFINISATVITVILALMGLIAYFDHLPVIQKDKSLLFAELLIALSILVLAALVWLSEPMENMRHQLNNHLQIVIGIILFSFKSLDYAKSNLSLLNKEKK
jgi:hypothetical protein